MAGFDFFRARDRIRCRITEEVHARRDAVRFVQFMQRQEQMRKADEAEQKAVEESEGLGEDPPVPSAGNLT